MQDKKKSKDDWREDLYNLIELLRRRQLIGSQAQGKKTLEVLRQIVDKCTWKSVNELILKIKEIGSEVASIDPLAFSVNSTFRRFLNVVRKEYIKLCTKQPACYYYFSSSENTDLQGDVNMCLLRSAIFEGINELLHEYGQSWDFDQCLDIFTANETVLIYGYSNLIERMLKSISKKKTNLTVFILDGDPEKYSYEFAQKISFEFGINAILMSDSSLFSLIPKVSKVILSAKAIFPDGSAVTLSGGYLISHTAKFFSVPIVIVAALYKLCHFPLFDTQRTNLIVPPNLFADSLKQLSNVHFAINKLDLIPDNLISIFLTENGSMSKLQLYEIFKGRFHPDDL
ncbi:translation initiation factor IF-2B beta EIF-2 [Cryptosporidium ubiquitum]|uniref:Translation initiation factor eIF2B subunit beta n=1 Tax=Cryptosporidium ubiquitum TaxID=857276 RepID=A0A1J4MR09_9CRYT|nr:translation initiation factor IF-2B beta EIF-2 [Cryptosporidium ubiquitum]OII75325.1 translation initiation factor IF-2B beta EIF-2 [Cryptosporidium ubiquitum]